MRRVLFDSSVYGRLVEDSEAISIIEKMIPGRIVIYGSEIVRKELRNTPKYALHGGRKLRLNKIVKVLSSDYYTEYIRQGGSRSNKKMINDLLIIATATVYNLDIIISDDEKTMLSAEAINAYRIINKKYGLKNPEFLSYKRFESSIKSQEDFPV